MNIHWPHTQFIQSVSDTRDFPSIDLPTVAIAGHSNVGKSTLLNALFDRKGMVKTSKRPGCTRLLNLFSLDEKILIVDLPGYGYARAPKSEKRRWAKLIELYLRGDAAPALVLVLLDIRHGPKDSDLKLIEWLNDAGIRWLPVATKADKLTGNKRTVRLKEMCENMGGLLKPHPTSSSTGRGIPELRTLMLEELKLAQETVWDEVEPTENL
ncbi:MAG: ribosome biogenesis GTP-binding protein YihA/YsxC [Mariprofundaceae bacterium]|nr:ribosome biogenesis GTP-binding protein YihA/YsxC [Mariprofundaceae bacterium]